MTLRRGQALFKVFIFWCYVSVEKTDKLRVKNHIHSAHKARFQHNFYQIVWLFSQLLNKEDFDFYVF